MKNLMITTVLSLLAFFSFAQETPTKLKDEVVEASCGTCKLGLEGKKCELAIRYKGTSYFVDGSTIKDHGDEHGKNGFCNAIKKAKVSGNIENGRFKSTSFKVLKAEKKTKATS